MFWTQVTKESEQISIVNRSVLVRREVKFGSIFEVRPQRTIIEASLAPPSKRWAGVQWGVCSGIEASSKRK